MDYLDFVYAAMWFLAGLLLLGKLRKENRVFVFIGCIFLFMGCWWLADALLKDVDLFSGFYVWIFRGVMAVAVVGTVLAYYRQKQRDKVASQEAEDAGEPEDGAAALENGEAEDFEELEEEETEDSEKPEEKDGGNEDEG